MTGAARALTCAAAVLLLPAAAPAAGDRGSVTRTATSVADAWVSAAAPRNGHGRAARMVVGGRPGARAYVRFRLEGLGAGVGRAILRVWSYGASPQGLEVLAVEKKRWRERELTLRNAPRPASGRRTLSGAVRGGRWTSVDVTHLVNLVSGGGSLSFALESRSTRPLQLASREAPSRAPRLVVTTIAGEPALPLRGVFYYPWFPETWTVGGQPVRYSPTLGRYDSSSEAVIKEHVEAMEYARLRLGISSWWGHEHRTNARLATLLSVTSRTSRRFRWAVYYEPEAQGNPTVRQLTTDIRYLVRRYGAHRSYLRLGGKPVLFVYSDSGDGCAMVARWKEANTEGAYLVLKVFPGYRSCAQQPDGWHQYAPAQAADDQSPSSYTISPGFHKADEASPRLGRDLARWRRDVRAMKASKAAFQLVTTFNEWGEGTAVEAAREWATHSGYGAYLDALRGVSAPATVPPAPAPTAQGPTLVGAGDIASCSSSGDEQTAAVLDRIAGTVFIPGDIAYESGSSSEFARCYDPSWGRHKSRTRPAPGNHEYGTSGAAGYFDYFGAAAGPGRRGYYSYEVGSWHVVSLNSNCSRAGGCDRGSPQERWLRADLASHRVRCVLAYWHHPRYSSGQHGSHESVQPLWEALHEAGAEIVVGGHDHDYERFAPLDAAGRPDAARGIRSFVVGTGGKNHYPIRGRILPNSVVRNDDTFGVIKFTLQPGRYTWEFVPVAGKQFTDSGSGTCH